MSAQFLSQRYIFRVVGLVLAVLGGLAAAVGNNGGSFLGARTAVPVDQVQLKVPVSYLYVVGIEGVGHHGVTPALSVIAKSCGYHVDYEPRTLRHAQSRAQSRSFISYLSSIINWSKAKTHGQDKVLVIEDQSFPTDNLKRVSTPGVKKREAKYNIEWLYDQAQNGKADVRFFHLTRDFYRTVASHPEFDNGFENHALVLKDYLDYIHTEKVRVDAKQPDLWRQIHYEWFTNMHNCTALVSAVIEFTGWNECDVDFACEVLQQTLRKSTPRIVNETEYAFAQSLNATIPVPDLDISEDRVHRFKRVVSSRDWSRYDAELRSAKGQAYHLKEKRPARPVRAKNATTATSGRYESTVQRAPTVRHEARSSPVRAATPQAAQDRRERFTRTPPAKLRDQRLNAATGNEVVRPVSHPAKATGGRVVAPRNHPRSQHATVALESTREQSPAAVRLADSHAVTRQDSHVTRVPPVTQQQTSRPQGTSGAREVVQHSGNLRGSANQRATVTDAAVTAHRFAHNQGQTTAAGGTVVAAHRFAHNLDRGLGRGYSQAVRTHQQHRLTADSSPDQREVE